MFGRQYNMQKPYPICHFAFGKELHERDGSPAFLRLKFHYKKLKDVASKESLLVSIPVTQTSEVSQISAAQKS